MALPRLTGDQYRLLVEHAPVMIWRAGLDAKCDYFNETWLAFTGRAMEQEIGDGWIEGVHPDDLARCVRTYLDHFDRRAVFEMEYRLRRHDGVYRYIFDRGVPFDDDAGAFAGFIGSCVDVHDRRMLDLGKTSFLSLAAHELRTPVTAMKNYLEAIRRTIRRGHPAPESVFDRLEAQANRITALARELGETARLEEGGELPLALADVDLAALARAVVEASRASLAAHGGAEPTATLILEGAEAPRPVRGDPGRLEIVLANLVDNAIKYSPDGGEIRVALASAGDEHRVCVTDRGIGIPREELANVSRRYFRASNASASNYPGMGIGLSLSRAIVERHGGRLRVESELGAGTRVEIALPAGRPEV